MTGLAAVLIGSLASDPSAVPVLVGAGGSGRTRTLLAMRDQVGTVERAVRGPRARGDVAGVLPPFADHPLALRDARRRTAAPAPDTSRSRSTKR